MGISESSLKPFSFLSHCKRFKTCDLFTKKNTFPDSHFCSGMNVNPISIVFRLKLNKFEILSCVQSERVETKKYILV